MLKRNRRLRNSTAIRDMVAETHLNTSNLIAPLFIKEGSNISEPINSMPGQYRFSLDRAKSEIKEMISLGISTFALFPVINEHLKNIHATEAVNKDGFYIRIINEIKESIPEAVLMTDVALDPYNSDGHDGIVCQKTRKILNDITVDRLVEMSILQAEAGADIIAPSDMMDGRIGAIRNELEKCNKTDVLIMSYCAKYSSQFYGPFRDALFSAPKMGDKKTYQMDPRNSKEAIREALQDEEEGADILLIKPGLPYLDIIYALSQHTTLPIAAYQVSGEYSMIKAMGDLKWGNATGMMEETLMSLSRAGASIIITYFAKEWAKIVNR